jgi:hypothetical protein
VEDILLAFLLGGPRVSVSLPRPSFIALNIYAAPQHLVLTSMLHEIVRGPRLPIGPRLCRIVDATFREIISPGTSVNKPL